MAKEIRSFKHLLGKLDGISDGQLEAHFGLYEGYVKKLNEIEDKLTKTDKGLSNYSFGEYAELKRRYTGLAVPGWVITCLDTTTGRLNNVQIMEHHIGFPVNHIPLMVMDTWEHAFFLDYKANRGAYIDTFMKNINWNVVNDRLSKALLAR